MHEPYQETLLQTMKPIFEHRSYRGTLPLQASVNTDFSFFPHYHPDLELVFVLCGSMGMRVDDRVLTLEAEQGMIIRPRAIHSYAATTAGTRTIIVVFDQSVFPHHLESALRIDTLVFDRKLLSLSRAHAESTQDYFDRVRDILHALVDNTNLLSSAGTCMAMGRILELVGILCDAQEHTVPTQSPRHEGEAAQGSVDLARHMMDYIDNHLTEALDLAVIARKFDYSYTYLSRVFKQALGVDFTTYVNTTRIMAARHRVIETDLPVSTICFDSGFQSLRTFNRVFLDVFGTSPSAMRSGLHR